MTSTPTETPKVYVVIGRNRAGDRKVRVETHHAAYFDDAAHALDWAQKCGVSIDEFVSAVEPAGIFEITGNPDGPFYAEGLSVESGWFCFDADSRVELANTLRELEFSEGEITEAMPGPKGEVFVVVTTTNDDMEVLDRPPLWNLAEHNQVCYRAFINGGDSIRHDPDPRKD